LHPHTIVDAGANIGCTSIFFGTRWPTARIYAVEPDPANAATLRANAAPFPNVTILQAALWPTRTTLRLVTENRAASATEVVDDPARPGNPVPTVTLPDLLDMAGGRIDLLKMDIEGADFDVFGAFEPAWWDRIGAAMVELHDDLRPGASRRFFNTLAGRTHRMFSRGDVIVILPEPHTS
jgi:FkbM family methyltransferase